MDIILTRRSVRKYTDQEVTEDQIADLLRAAMAAPSAGNQQPWHFVVIRNRETLNEITKVHPYAAMLKEASCAILVCGDESVERYKGYWIQDCSAATQNILLAAHSLGLGAVWLGVHPRQERVEGIKRILNIPKEINPLSLVSIGYPAEEKGAVNRYDEAKIHYEKCGDGSLSRGWTVPCPPPPALSSPRHGTVPCPVHTNYLL